MNNLHTSLETLELPSEVTSLDAMAQLDWPRLECLTLVGDSLTQIHTPIIAVISQMPHLRSLSLQLTILPNMSKQCVWPRGWTTGNVLPPIEELTVAHPHPNDLLYTHLPHSVRRLSLCCSPCYALQLWLPYEYRRWQSPLPTAAELLRILSGSQLSHLTHLSMEYGPDDREEQFLQHLYVAFPQLSSIELHRMIVPKLRWPQDVLAVSDLLCSCHSDVLTSSRKCFSRSRFLTNYHVYLACARFA